MTFNFPNGSDEKNKMKSSPKKANTISERIAAARSGNSSSSTTDDRERAERRKIEYDENQARLRALHSKESTQKADDAELARLALEAELINSRKLEEENIKRLQESQALEEALEKAKADLAAAQNPKSRMVCPHCQERGSVRTSKVSRKKGVSGSKATGALLTAGFSLLITGLSRKEEETEARCSNCSAVWFF